MHKPVGMSDIYIYIYIYICRLSLTQISVCVSIVFGSKRMSVYRSINQMGIQICVSVEFDSEGVEERG